jgi:cytochrome c
MNYCRSAAIACTALLLLGSSALAATGDAGRGQRLFRACAACHALAPGKNMTGPSLAGVWNRKAGGLDSFHRYSPALKSSDIVWNDDTLDTWIKDPRSMIPGTTMTFPGINDAQARADLLAFLKKATQPGNGDAAQRGGPMGGMQGMQGMMGGGRVPNLKKLDADQEVSRVTYCKDTYSVTTADGETHLFWERNLRFKTDSGEDGPEKGKPALVGAGMMGDRADVIFADPSEISRSVAEKC